MKLCTLPPLDDLEDRGFWMTPFWWVEGFIGYHVVAVIGMGESNPFLLIRSEVKSDEGRDELAAYSICESPTLVWGEKLAIEDRIILFIQDYQESLLAHWNGVLFSNDLARIIGEKAMKHDHCWSQHLWGRKVFEFEHTREDKNGSRHFGISIGWNFRKSHAGPYLYFHFWRETVSIQIYDGRHWCYEHGCWFDEPAHPYHEHGEGA